MIVKNYNILSKIINLAYKFFLFLYQKLISNLNNLILIYNRIK